MKSTLYGQYCPIAISLEIFGRALDPVDRSGTDRRVVPLMSRSLLSDRLKELEAAKIVTRSHSARSGHAEYALSEGGRSLLSVIGAVGEWGQKWLNKSPALDQIDGGYLMWNIRKTSTWIAEMGPRAVARFEFTDWNEERRHHWLVIEKQDVDLCYVDPGHDIDVWIQTDLRTMVEIWMGWRPLSRALAQKNFTIDGPTGLIQKPLRWIGQSPLAGVAERPSEEQVGYMLDKVRA